MRMLELKDKCVKNKNEKEKEMGKGKGGGERYIISIKGGRNNSIEPDVKVCLYPLSTFTLSNPILIPPSPLGSA